MELHAQEAAMLTIYKTTPEGLQTLESTANGCWIKATSPDAEEIEQLKHIRLSSAYDLQPDI